MRDDRERLEDILEAIAHVEKYAAQGRQAFEQDELIQTWIVHHLQIIGEAASRVSDEAQSRHPEISWANIVAMRNIIVHEYFGIDHDEVWSTVEFDLPVLKRQVEAMLK
ncbi:MAG: DUF86 domain-containing protein [Chloroflexi bacterium]|nr:DUF86 domain-containing protein [Chloroflexota bacterium]